MGDDDTGEGGICDESGNALAVDGCPVRAATAWQTDDDADRTW